MAEMVKNSSAMQETWFQSLGLRRSPEVGHSKPIQYSGLENPMNRGVWWATPWGVKKSDTTEKLTHRPLGAERVNAYICRMLGPRPVNRKGNQS